MLSLLPRSALVKWLLAVAGFYALSLILLSLGGFTVVEILRDPAQHLRVSSLLGFLSNAGVWFWIGAGAITLSSALQRPAGDLRQTLMLVAGFSLVLAADDHFLIHDRFIAEGIMVPIYIYVLWRLMSKHRAVIFGCDKTAFLTAAGLLGGSVMVDAVQEILPISYSASQIIEEGCKFLGGAAWLYFCHRLGAYQPALEDSATVTPEA